MTKTRNSNSTTTTTTTTTGGGIGATTAMRVIVPLQGVVQGRGGLVLGSVLPCALFYFLQLYLKRNRSGGRPTSPTTHPPDDPSLSPTSTHMAETSSSSSSAGLQRVHSRSLLSPRGFGGSAHISSRANSIVKQADSPYYIGLKRFSEDPFHESKNPDGIIQLGLAENKLCLDLVQEWLLENGKDSVLGRDISKSAAYHPFDGLMELKLAIAEFMSQAMEKPGSFNPSQLVLTSGETPAIETLTFCLADAGNAFLVPSPYNPDLDRDIKLRTGVEIIPVPCRSADNFSLKTTALDRAFNHAKKRGLKVRGIVISNPSNPVGRYLDRETLYHLLDFATKKNLHLISIETVSGSNLGDGNSIRVSEILDSNDFDHNKIHLIYGFSRDLGFIYTSNEIVLDAAKKMARFSSVAIPIQKMLLSLLLDTGFVQKFVETNRERIRRVKLEFVEGLKQLSIHCAKSNGGLYCWADMSGLLRSYSEKGEIELWEKMLNVAKINLTPGSSCHCIEPGWFRFCFGALSEKDISVIMNRIKGVLETWKKIGVR